MFHRTAHVHSQKAILSYAPTVSMHCNGTLPVSLILGDHATWISQTQNFLQVPSVLY